ncbi:MAG: hypothetical protein ABSH10_07925 [Phycisphaerae bacterium]|jgi:uncharacterized membrane protein
MKTTVLSVMALALAIVVGGCESPRGGGMSGGEGFKISTPTFTTKVKQGETESVTISLNRGEYFKRDVTLEIKASKGISVEPTHALVRGNEQPDVHLRITAAKDADLGEYKIFVKGTPETGQPTSTEITVKVVAP